MAIEAELREIRIDETGHEQVIILIEKDGERYLPIMIGLCEANAILVHVHGFRPPRPITHDLLKNMVEALDGEVQSVLIDDLEQGTFYAKVEVSLHGQTRQIDARPSDAVALAVRVGCPIFIEENVLEENQAEVF